MSDAHLQTICDLVQEDVGKRGLRADPTDNLISRTTGEFAAACRSIAACEKPALAVLTGFYIISGTPPGGETDGPLGALFLARALVPLGITVALVTDSFCSRAFDIGLEACGLAEKVDVLVLPTLFSASPGRLDAEWTAFADWHGLTHLVALERVGPSHADGRCYTMRCRDITDFMSPAHLLVEDAPRRRPPLTTIGIGDGGNEIGMGKIPREVIARNMKGGDKVACRVATDYLIVSGVSNWGAYGLAAGVRRLRSAPHDPALFDSARERELLGLMVERGPLVDGVTGKQTVTVDGLPFEQYVEVLKNIGQVVSSLGAS